MEFKDGMIGITWLGPESWLGVRLGVWILIVSSLILLFLIVHVSAKQDWFKRLNNSMIQNGASPISGRRSTWR